MIKDVNYQNFAAADYDANDDDDGGDDDDVDVEDNQRRAYCASRNVRVVRSTRNPPHIITAFCIFSYMMMRELLKFRLGCHSQFDIISQ